MIDIKQTLDVLKSHDFKGGGPHIEIAKGKNELCETFEGMKAKIQRILWVKK